MHVVTKRGQEKLRKTTVGWRLLVKWKDQSESWIRLKDIKESHPVDVADFSEERGITYEPYFTLLVPYTIRKCNVILAAVKSRIRKTTHKYGIKIPSTID